MHLRRNTKRIQNSTKNRPVYGMKYAGLGFFTGWNVGLNTIRASNTLDTDDNIPEPIDEIIIDFEDYFLGPISDSSVPYIQGGWSGGAQPYFQNDSTDNEAITILRSYSGNKSWNIGTDALYGIPGQGSPFTPMLNIESIASNETAFNESIKGKTFHYEFQLYSVTQPAGLELHLVIYNGSYAGNDRTGFNLYIDQSGSDIEISTYTYNGGSFSFITMETVNSDMWHKIQIDITYAEDGNPENDVYKYTIGSNEYYIDSWPNLWRKDNSFPLSYGSRIAFAFNVTTTTGVPVEGFYIDDLILRDPLTKIIKPPGYSLPGTIQISNIIPNMIDVKDNLGNPIIPLKTVDI